MDKPLVSILIRTYNRLENLRDALKSVSAQTWPHIEVVVVNDGGADITNVVNEFKNVIPINSITLSENKGRAFASNVALKAAKGKYLNFLDDDDRLLPFHVEKLLNFIANEKCRAAYSLCEFVVYERENSQFVEQDRYVFCDVDFRPGWLLQKDFLPIMTVLFERELIKEVGFFDENFPIFEDWDFWLRMVKVEKIFRYPMVTAEYCQFNGMDNPSGHHKYLNEYSEWLIRFYEKHFPELNYATFVEHVRKDLWPRIDLEQKLKRKITQLENRISHLESTLSWRWTKPFRAILTRKVRKQFRNSLGL